MDHFIFPGSTSLLEDSEVKTSGLVKQGAPHSVLDKRLLKPRMNRCTRISPRLFSCLTDSMSFFVYFITFTYNKRCVNVKTENTG